MSSVASPRNLGRTVRYTLRIQGVEIGTSDLAQFDRHPGVADRYRSARDALGLELVDQRGALIPTTAIDISDYSLEAGTEAYEVMV